MTYLGIDFGTVRIGVAISDSEGKIAMPLCQFRNEGDEKAAQRLSQLAAQYGARAIVVGLPLNMDGSRGRQAQRVAAFAQKLKNCSAIPVVMQDERLSTTAALDALDGAFRGAGRTERLDAVAAQMILQRWLDSRREPAV